MTLATLCDSFCDHATYFLNYAPATISRYRTTLHLLQKHGGVSSLDECTPKMLREFFWRGRSERKWSTNAFATYHKSLAVFFRWCRVNGYLDRNPLEGIGVPKLERRIPKHLTLHQAERFVAHVANYPHYSRFQRARNLALIGICLWAGLRRGELLRLQLFDVDLENQTIFVRQAKGHKDRQVPINPKLLPILAQYVRERRAQRKTCPEFFTSLHHNEGLGLQGLRHTVASLERAGRIRFHLHMLRHTYATLMLEGGADLYSLSQTLGHSNITTTTVYLHASPAHLRAQVAKHPLGEPH